MEGRARVGEAVGWRWRRTWGMRRGEESRAGQRSYHARPPARPPPSLAPTHHGCIKRRSDGAARRRVKHRGTVISRQADKNKMCALTTCWEFAYPGPRLSFTRSFVPWLVGWSVRPSIHRFVPPSLVASLPRCLPSLVPSLAFTPAHISLSLHSMLFTERTAAHFFSAVIIQVLREVRLAAENVLFRASAVCG